MKIMHKAMAAMAIGITVFAMSAAAQTVTGSGTSNTVPVFTGTSTLGNSPISVSGSNVGIGTTSSSASLTVAGTIAGRTTNGYPAAGAGYYAFTTNNTDAFNGGLTVQYLNGGVLTDGLNLQNGSLTMAGTIFGRTSNGFPGGTASGYYALTTNNMDSNNGGLTMQYLSGGVLTNGLSLTGTGSVGIGTTNPQYKLSVNGTIQAKEVLVNTGWADYVFQPDYRVTPLTEVAAFIKANHHLPNIPSESEVKESGVNLGDMQAKLLAKIEELTLQMIQLDEKNRKLEKSVKQIQVSRISTSKKNGGK